MNKEPKAPAQSTILEKDVRWGEFKLEDVLNWQEQKEINPLHLKRLSISSEEKYPFYGQAIANNGIITYCELSQEVLNNKNGKPTILIHSNNQNIVYLETPFYLKDGHGATSVLQAETLNRLTALYIMTAIKKVISERFSYNAKATKIGLKKTAIQLPITADNTPDFNYMEDYITHIQNEYVIDLERKRNLHLNAYLKVTGFANYELDNADIEALERDVKWGEFRVGDLFENIQQGSRLKKLDQIDGDLPFIMAGTTNTGLVNYVGNTLVRRFPKNSLTIDIFGNVFYRNYEYAAGDDTGVYWNEKKHLSREVMLYYCTALEVALRGKFSYGKKLRSSQSHDILVCLPATNGNTPDFDYMEAYIKAQQKLVTANAIRNLDLEISATKYVIKRELKLGGV
ncbi:MAG: restriction endonuclease subunit S [Oscillospiraceae bacterium]|nr:restriction endonuclease subunit S [Oscillospiraceae bacterium]